MDHYENERTDLPVQDMPEVEPVAAETTEYTAPQPTVEPVTEPIADQETVQNPDGYYHGVGAGQRETFYSAPYPPYGYQPQPNYNNQQPKQPWQNYYQAPQQPQPPAPEKPKKRRSGKVWKGIVAAVLAIVLVAVACGATVLCVNHAWQEQYDLLKQNMNEKIDALQQQLDDQAAVGAPGGQLATGENLSANEIYRRNVNSVVAITSTIRTSSSGGMYEASSAGTGFVITANGYIVTNHHVIDGATAITATMHSGQAYRAQLIGSDATNDIAVLKIEATDLSPVIIGSSAAMQVGDQVVAIGNALGELSASLTVGYVSGIDRDVSTDGSVITMIQTDAAINSGNSGGPLFNARGEVIGINTAKYSGTTNSGASIEGIGFAIPMDDVIGMLEDLIKFGYIRSAYLGIYCTEVSESAIYYGVPKGVYVQEAVEGFCAKAAGVQAGDIIIGLGGYDVESMNDLSKALRAYEAGDTVTLTVWRSGREVLLKVTLDEKPHG